MKKIVCVRVRACVRVRVCVCCMNNVCGLLFGKLKNAILPQLLRVELCTNK